MELKVWVDGMVRVVCGLSLNTSSKDVVIALAQSIGQTGRYILVMKLHGHERQLLADDCPLQHLVQLGQLSAAVQFILRRTGPSLSEGPSTPTRERRLPRSRSSEQQTVDHTVPQKSFSSSTHPRWTTPSQTRSPSPQASPEPRASPIAFLNSHHPMVAASSSLKEEVYRQILQQQKRLQDLQHQLQSLERETELWECERSSGPGLSLNPGEIEELEEQLRQNETELMLTGHWEKQLGTETDRERDLHRHLEQLHSSMDDHSHRIMQLIEHAAHLEQDLKITAHTQSSNALTPQQDEVLKPLEQELRHRQQQAEGLDAALLETHRELQTAEERLQDRWKMIEELNKELRQCQLQQFIQQSSSSSHSEHTNSLHATDVYLNNAGIVELAGY